MVWLEELRSRRASTPVIVLTAPNDVAAAIHSLRRGANDCLAKPFELDDLVARIATVLPRTASFDSKA
ncbi:MAG: hypothetical protein B7Y51_06645 [Burkholderiales bacterium 28-67-8]|nr:MAG: hypothetical protein B7Y51_06645 [Burkholderiales bacterium 28-67-8]